jgi:membrane protein implicated in regulation of membrane protease activity
MFAVSGLSELIAYIAALGAWSWIIAGAVLLAFELAVPGAFMMWLGLAAVLVGAISLAVDWSWQWQCVAFAAFALASVPLWRRFARKVEPESQAPLLNRRTEALVGRVFTLDKPIVDGVGTVRIDDTIWRVRGPDRPAGSRVRVTQADGANLAVEPAG